MGSLKNRVIIIVASMVLALVFTTAYRLWKYQEMVKKITVMEPDLSRISDGVYEGEFDMKLVFAKVRVLIEKNKIKNIIIIEHKNGRGGKAEVIAEDIISKQKLGVNCITGATASSKVLIKAVENALKVK